VTAPVWQENRWLRAEEIYGAAAGEGPVIELPRIVYDARNQRLLILGNQRLPYGNQVQILANQLFTFDLRSGLHGRWIHHGTLPIWWSWITFFSLSVDPYENRAILIDGAYDGGWTDTSVFTLDLDTLELVERPPRSLSMGPLRSTDMAPTSSQQSERCTSTGGSTNTAPPQVRSGSTCGPGRGPTSAMAARPRTARASATCHSCRTT
jgi:hypothetical protein